MTEIQIFYDGPIVKRAEAIEQGLTHYFTGNPCKYGHVSERILVSRLCKECKRIQAISYYERNKDKSKEYRKSKKEKIKETKRKYHIKNKDDISKKSSEYYYNNKNLFSEYRKRNLEKYAAHQRNRRALIKNAEGSHTKEDVDEIYRNQKGLCAEPTCSKDLYDGYHVDHIMPISLGGGNGPDNLQCLCPECNRKKSSKHPIDWALENGRLL